MDIIRRDLAKLKEEIDYLRSKIRRNDLRIQQLEKEIKK